MMVGALTLVQLLHASYRILRFIQLDTHPSVRSTDTFSDIDIVSLKSSVRLKEYTCTWSSLLKSRRVRVTMRLLGSFSVSSE